MKTKYNSLGEELPDATPLELPLGWNRPMPLHEMIRQMIQQVSSEVEDKGGESLEDAGDFDVGDDYEPESGLEFEADAEAYFRESNRRFVEEKPIEKLQDVTGQKIKSDIKSGEEKIAEVENAKVVDGKTE